MRNQSFFRFAALLILVAVTALSFTTQPGWRKLGSRQVNYSLDHDVIDVSIRDGRFQQLQFVVTWGSLNMHKCTVFFENGGSQDIGLRHNFNRRSASRIIDLKGNQRFIEKISFWYDSKNASRSKAVLTVFGK